MKTLLTSALLATSLGVTGLGLTGCISVIDSGNNDGAYSNFDGVSSSDKRKIEAVVYDYFDGQGEADFDRLDRAFNENAAMFGVRTSDSGNEYVRVWPDMNKVIKNWGDNPNPAGDRDSAILDMHVTDGRIATVHFRSADRFYDTLTLVKVNGDWEIAAKVFVNQ